jgi:hypothetical protein
VLTWRYLVLSTVFWILVLAYLFIWNPPETLAGFCLRLAAVICIYLFTNLAGIGYWRSPDTWWLLWVALLPSAILFGLAYLALSLVTLALVGCLQLVLTPTIWVLNKDLRRVTAVSLMLLIVGFHFDLLAS